MTSVDRFWEVVRRWEKDHSRIMVEFMRTSAPFLEQDFTCRVARVEGTLVVFRDIETAEERPVDFDGADIRAGEFERIQLVEWVCVFNVVWEGEAFLRCSLVEMREYGKPN
jgi:hypothetical protein